MNPIESILDYEKEIQQKLELQQREIQKSENDKANKALKEQNAKLQNMLNEQQQTIEIIQNKFEKILVEGQITINNLETEISILKKEKNSSSVLIFLIFDQQFVRL